MVWAVTGINQPTAGQFGHYTLAVPTGATNSSSSPPGGTVSMDLYVKFGSAPTDSVYDCLVPTAAPMRDLQYHDGADRHLLRAPRPAPSRV